MTTSPPHSVAVIGLVLTFSDDAGTRAATLECLRAMPHLRLGSLQGAWLPLSAETEDPEALHERLSLLPGVLSVDVTFVEVIPADSQPFSPTP